MSLIQFVDTFEEVPTGPGPVLPADSSVAGMVELMLKGRTRLHELMRAGSHSTELVPRFLGIALAGFTIYGIAATIVLNVSGVWPSWVPAASWPGRTMANLTLAYDLGLIAAVGVCLPSFYFYGLLAGLEIAILDVAAHAMKCAAMTALMLVGILPMYVALALGMIVFGASAEWKELTIALGLALPFIAGWWGVLSLYTGFVRLAETMPPGCRAAREGFLRLLTLAWSACYSVVTPVMIYTLWRHFSS
jgi:hypothetical protein